MRRTNWVAVVVSLVLVAALAFVGVYSEGFKNWDVKTWFENSPTVSPTDPADPNDPKNPADPNDPKDPAEPETPDVSEQKLLLWDRRNEMFLFPGVDNFISSGDKCLQIFSDDSKTPVSVENLEVKIEFFGGFYIGLLLCDLVGEVPQIREPREFREISQGVYYKYPVNDLSAIPVSVGNDGIFSAKTYSLVTASSFLSDGSFALVAEHEVKDYLSQTYIYEGARCYRGAFFENIFDPYILVSVHDKVSGRSTDVFRFYVADL